MNKMQAFILIAVLAGVGILALTLLLILAPETADKFGDYVLNLLIVLGGFAGLSIMQGKQGESIAQQSETIQTIKEQTNGTLSKRDDEITALRAALQERAPDLLADLDSGAVRVQVIAKE